MILKIFSDRQWKEFREIYCWSLKQRFGIMLLYMALLFMALPMILLLVITNTRDNANLYSVNGASVTQMEQSFSGALRVLLPVLIVPLTLLFVLILGVMLYNYMHQKRSVDYFHSLPAGRTPLLLGKFFAGLTMIFIPLIVNFGIVAILIAANNLGSAVPLISILYDLLWAMLMVTATFSFTVLMAVCSGTTMDMVISAIVINLAYPILILLCQVTASSVLPGLNLTDNLMNVYTFAFAPFAAAFMPFLPNSYSGSTMGSPFTVWWILLTIVLFAACIALYRKRKSESAENNFAFPLPKIIIRFTATAAVGLGLGFLFISMTANNNQFYFFLGVFLGSLITHIIADVIYSRGFKGLKKSFVYYGAFAALFLIAYLPLSFGFFGYDTRIPATSDVASVSFNSNYASDNYYTTYNGTAKVLDEKGNAIATIEGKLTSSENIEKIRTFHQIITDAYKQKSYPYRINTSGGGRVTITYHLKNGHTLTRSYSSYDILDNNSNVQEYNMKLTNTEEYKASGILINYLEPSYIQEIKITSDNKTGSTIDSGNDIKLEIINAVKQDIMSANSTTVINDPGASVDTNIDFVFKDGFEPTQGSPLKELVGNYTGKVHFSNIYGSGYYISVPKSYTHTMALIKKYGWVK